MIYSNGDVYEGYSIYGILFGKGKMIWKDGTVQDGYWRENLFVNITDCSGNCSDGYGEVDYKDEENYIYFKYKGQWKYKVPHGKGEWESVESVSAGYVQVLYDILSSVLPVQ